MGIRGGKLEETGKNFRHFLLFTKCYSGGKLEKDEMGEACGAYAGKKCVQVLVGTRVGKRPL